MISSIQHTHNEVPRALRLERRVLDNLKVARGLELADGVLERAANGGNRAHDTVVSQDTDAELLGALDLAPWLDL